MDQGKFSVHCHMHPGSTLLPSCWETRGFSYEMNLGLPSGIRPQSTLKRPLGSIVGRTEDFAGDPSKFILFFEPPAKPQTCVCPPPGMSCSPGIPPGGTPLFPPKWYQWHRNRGKTIFDDPRLAPPLFWSPIVFLDGRGEVLDFTKALRTNPYYPFEETTDWMWYRPEVENAPLPDR
jgi:hypothetical protein